MSNQTQLALAISIATDAHKDQYDKQGKPYILHALHVMNNLLYDEDLATIGVLHDVVEDSDYTLFDLYELGINSSTVLRSLELLTKNSKQPYEAYIKGVCTNKAAMLVKLEDLKHNSCITRSKGTSPKDIIRLKKYQNVYIKIVEELSKY